MTTRGLILKYENILEVYVVFIVMVIVENVDILKPETPNDIISFHRCS